MQRSADLSGSACPPPLPIGCCADDRRRARADVPHRVPDIVDQLLDLFLQSTPPLLAELRAAVDGNDREELRRVAHKLKGSCQNVGATLMATLCHALETGEGDAGGTLAELDAAFLGTATALRRALTA